MSTANVAAMVREGVNALKMGNKEEARALLMKAVEHDPYHEDAWMWLSGVVETDEEQLVCLENVLDINESNSRARQGLDYLLKQNPSLQSSRSPSAPPPSGSSAFGAPSANADPFAPPSIDPFGAPQTSVEWSTPTSSASAAAPPTPPEYQPAALDDWVEGLQIKPEAGGTQSIPPSINFGGFDDDGMESGPFSMSAGSAPSAMGGKGGVFADDLAPSDYDTVPGFDDEAPAKRGGKKGRDKGKAQKRGKTSAPPVINEAPIARPVQVGDTDDPLSLIPSEVAATRLPGTTERLPAGHIATLTLLVIGNIAAAAVVMWYLLGG